MQQRQLGQSILGFFRATGLFSTFSFHGTKTITTGEGGMLLTNDEELYRKIVQLNNHGRNPTESKQFWPEILGYKFRISNIQAALGCAQLKRIDELVSRKREILQYYKKHLLPLDSLSLNHEPEGCFIGAWMPNLVFDTSMGLHREYIQKSFKLMGIDARVFFGLYPNYLCSTGNLKINLLVILQKDPSTFLAMLI